MVVRFSDVVLDPDRMSLHRGGDEVAVEPQVFEVLNYLVTHRDRMVPKHELLDEIWGDRFVSESALSSRIKSARQAVGDNGRDQRLIRTVHGRGFRFVGEVRDVGELPTAGAGEAPAAAVSAEVPAMGVSVGLSGLSAADLPAHVLDTLAAGSGLVVEVVGDRGPARSAAVADVLHVARGRAVLVGRGGGGALRPMGGMLDALDEWVRRCPDLLDELPAGCAEELRTAIAGTGAVTIQRLHLATRELAAAAAARGGAVLAIEDVHLIDRSTLDLLAEVIRAARRLPVAVVVSHRRGFHVADSALTVEVDGGGPTSQGSAAGGGPAAEDLAADVRASLGRVAVVGERFDHVELEAATGLDAAAASRVLEQAVAAGVVEVDDLGPRFTDVEPWLAAAALLSGAERSAVHRRVAEALHAQGASPARVAERLLAAGDPEAAAPHQLEAAAVAAWSLQHSEVLHHTRTATEVADPWCRFQLLELRADALAALGEPEAVRCFRDALRLAPPERVPWLRARLARVHLIDGDLESAVEAMEGVTPTGGPEDGGILLVSGMLAYFRGELEVAEELAEAARGLALAPGAPPQMLDVITLQGMIAHSRGEWFGRLRRELRVLADSTQLATTVFDSQLCVTQYLLYGPTGRDEVVRLSDELRAAAEQLGSRRAVGFALTLAGEAKLLAGDLDGARHDLEASVEIHGEVGSETGLAHSLQRLGDLELALGDRAAAERRCRQALPLARWSPLSQHLTQRIYGTLISAAPDPESAVAVVEEARAVEDGPTSCEFCQVMVSVPAAMALAAAGRPEEAEVELALARRCVTYWDGPAWPAALAEAEATVVRARGDDEGARRLLAEAAAGFRAAGQPLDAARCDEALAD